MLIRISLVLVAITAGVAALLFAPPRALSQASQPISGYAWSDNVGWVSANASDLSGCPESPCSARLQEGELRGWLKALSANGSQNGGWDGFISLSGPGYGVSSAGGDGDGS